LKKVASLDKKTAVIVIQGQDKLIRLDLETNSIKYEKVPKYDDAIYFSSSSLCVGFRDNSIFLYKDGQTIMNWARCCPEIGWNRVLRKVGVSLAFLAELNQIVVVPTLKFEELTSMEPRILKNVMKNDTIRDFKFGRNKRIIAAGKRMQIGLYDYDGNELSKVTLKDAEPDYDSVYCIEPSHSGNYLAVSIWKASTRSPVIQIYEISDYDDLIFSSSYSFEHHGLYPSKTSSFIDLDFSISPLSKSCYVLTFSTVQNRHKLFSLYFSPSSLSSPLRLISSASHPIERLSSIKSSGKGVVLAVGKNEDVAKIEYTCEN